MTAYLGTVSGVDADARRVQVLVQPHGILTRFLRCVSPFGLIAALPAVGFGAAPAGYELLTPGPRPRVVRLRDDRPHPARLDAAGMWIRALALRLMFTLTGRV